MSAMNLERLPEPHVAEPRATDTPAERAAARAFAEENERKLQGVLADLWTHSETLVRKELELVKAEYEMRVGHAKAALRRGAISAGLYHAAYLTTLATLVLLLAQWIAPWIASLIVALGASGGALFFTWLGKEAVDEATEPSRQTKPRLTKPLTRPRAHSHT